MKRLLAAALLLIAGCQTYTTPNQKRWHSLNGDDVWVVNGPSVIVHAKQNCPELAAPKGEVIPCRVRGARLERPDGTYFGSEREQQQMCPTCVR